ncbi:NAD(P)-binding domain-containing protein [Methanobrevibacter sp.]|uniref:NAD(P)-binding domain-containing protein n=1 Tax=Methanobrevibacter sp. TaxID=66852 RepID=UPI0025F81539|nr:NAD(P)-binding domain-containing protein [Methanobrevibacter sp.]MBQ2831834.1 NAD(P)-dependent oxidoreductase [Methanobrevibacter sp.]
MIIGFIGFGKVSKNLFKLVDSDEVQFITSFENRSIKTVENIKKAGIDVLDSFKEVAIESDILISANSPNSALDVAKSYGKYAKGIFLDLNNISPDTTLEINSHVENLVDGAIIGKIDSENPILYLAGEKADELLFLNDFIKTEKISDNVGDVAILKLLRSSYTKTISAALIESYHIAKSHDLEDEFFDILKLTEGDDFREKSLSRINNTLYNSKRKSEELCEIIDYFKDEDLTMAKSALKKISQ